MLGPKVIDETNLAVLVDLPQVHALTRVNVAALNKRGRSEEVLVLRLVADFSLRCREIPNPFREERVVAETLVRAIIPLHAVSRSLPVSLRMGLQWVVSTRGSFALFLRIGGRRGDHDALVLHTFVEVLAPVVIVLCSCDASLRRAHLTVNIRRIGRMQALAQVKALVPRDVLDDRVSHGLLHETDARLSGGTTRSVRLSALALHRFGQEAGLGAV